MKKTFLLIVLWAVYGPGVCFSQNSGSFPSHPVVTDPKKSFDNVLSVQSTLADLFKSLTTTTANSQRADIYFLIAKYYAARRLKIDSALFYTEKIKQESEAGHYEKGIGKYYLSRAFSLFYHNINDRGIDTAVAIFIKHKDPVFLGYAYRVLGRQYRHTGDMGPSRNNYRASISLLSGAEETNELQKEYFELAEGFYQYHETDSAVFYLITSLRLSEKLKDSSLIFSTSGFLGQLYMTAGDLQNATKYLRYAFDSRSSAANRVEVRSRLAYYAQCLLMTGEFNQAEKIIGDYEKINKQLGDNWGDIMLKKIKGIDDYYKNNYPAALQYLRQASARTSEIKAFGFDTRSIYSYLAKTELKMGLYDSAVRHFSYVLQFSDASQFGTDMLEATLLTSECYKKKGNLDSAYHYFLLYDQVKDSVMAFRKEKTVMELTAKYETEKKEQEIQLLRGEKELSVYQLKLKIHEIEKQNLLDDQRSQQLALLSQQNRITLLEDSGKTLALENQHKEMIKKQSEYALLQKENELQTTIAGKEAQQKNFAYLAIAAVLFFSGYVFLRYMRHKKMSRQLTRSLAELKEAQEQLIKTEKEKEAENIRVRISRDIHDEVGATLSGVALFSEIARQKMKLHQVEDAEVYLDHITVNSKEMIEKMSDIVWAINPHNDSFRRIMSKLQSYTINLCAGKGIRPHFEIDDHISNYFPSMQVKKNIYLTFKEAVNNAVKYSGAKNIFLSVKNEEDFINLEIRDDGKGFDKNTCHQGNGLHNMQSRANDLQANFTIDSPPGKGTSVRLRFLFHPAGGQETTI